MTKGEFWEIVGVFDRIQESLNAKIEAHGTLPGSGTFNCADVQALASMSLRMAHVIVEIDKRKEY